MAQSFSSAVTANLGFRVLAGNCLAMAQGITGAPVMYASATDAANATRLRHHNKDIPNAMCVLWFDHWGTYGSPGNMQYKNWGHVVVYVPGKGYASSSPVGGETSTPYYYASINDVERAFNCTFRFWSEDINGKRVCTPASSPTQPPIHGMENDMIVFYTHALGKGKPGWLILGYTPKPLILSTQGSANEWQARIGKKTIITGYDGFRKYLSSAGGSAVQMARVSKG